MVIIGYTSAMCTLFLPYLGVCLRLPFAAATSGGWWCWRSCCSDGCGSGSAGGRGLVTRSSGATARHDSARLVARDGDADVSAQCRLVQVPNVLPGQLQAAGYNHNVP